MGNWLEIGWQRQIPESPHRCLHFVIETLTTPRFLFWKEHLQEWAETITLIGRSFSTILAQIFLSEYSFFFLNLCLFFLKFLGFSFLKSYVKHLQVFSLTTPISNLVLLFFLCPSLCRLPFFF